MSAAGEPEADRAAAGRLLEKIRAFVATLDDDERAMFATLVAPGVARAHEPEVQGFEATGWRPVDLPDSLAAALREEGVRVVGLE